jgi:hypothetical protein
MIDLKAIKRRNKNIFIVSLGTLIIILFVSQLVKESNLEKNKVIGVAKFLRINHDRRSKYSVEYQFFANGKLIESSDPLGASWPNHVREGEPVIRAFYPVEFDRENPKNSRIMLTERPLKLKQILNDHATIYGNVVLASPVSDNYVDLRIAYKYQGEVFNFRTRLHKDNLPCGNVESCKESQIKLLVSKHYPEVNDLYFKSYDRKNLLEQYKLN